MNYWDHTSGKVTLLDSEALTKQNRDVAYLLELNVDNLLFPFRYESGLQGSVNFKDDRLHGGWDSPLSHIRGTFTGHFLSAVALLCRDGDYSLLRAKAEFVVEEIRKCQLHNGNGWTFPFPEKYLHALRDGKHFWAPFYVCHKVLMGLFDVHRPLGNETAMTIITEATPWFRHFLEPIDDQNLAHMMNIEESGGIVELWADLYRYTGKEDYLWLMRKMERKELFDAMLQKRDVLTNMHANTTIPEIHGAAAAYEATGDPRYLKIAENYWELAVTRRGMFATGGQTCGEVWTPMMRQSARLGEQNQEHCVVYNMIRLADYLLRFTGKAEYADYIERNTINGLFAQTFWQARTLDSYGESIIPETGVVTYYLPLMPGGQKRWSRKTEDFWCCHCTAVQSNARYWEYIYYQKDRVLAIEQYQPSKLETQIDGKKVTVELKKEDSGISCIEISELAISADHRPDFDRYQIRIQAQEPVEATVRLRLPWWLSREPEFVVDGERIPCTAEDGYLNITRVWTDKQITVTLPRGLHVWPLADEKDTVAFLDGPDVLAGIVPEERILSGDKDHPETMLTAHNERVWGSWTKEYRTVGQQNGFYLKPIREIGKERYTVYFPIRKGHA